MAAGPGVVLGEGVVIVSGAFIVVGVEVGDDEGGGGGGGGEDCGPASVAVGSVCWLVSCYAQQSNLTTRARTETVRSHSQDRQGQLCSA